MSCDVGCRLGLDLALWLWCRLAATAPIRPLAWEPPCARGAALEETKRQKQTDRKNKLSPYKYLCKIFRVDIGFHNF